MTLSCSLVFPPCGTATFTEVNSLSTSSTTADALKIHSSLWKIFHRAPNSFWVLLSLHVNMWQSTQAQICRSRIRFEDTFLIVCILISGTALSVSSSCFGSWAFKVTRRWLPTIPDKQAATGLSPHSDRRKSTRGKKAFLNRFLLNTESFNFNHSFFLNQHHKPNQHFSC